MFLFKEYLVQIILGKGRMNLHIGEKYNNSEVKGGFLK